MPAKHEIKITVNQDIAKIKYIDAAIRLFKAQLAVSRYEINFQTFSPYYSGHESSNTREETEEYSIKRASNGLGTLIVHRESTELDFPTLEFPQGIADEEISITAQLKIEREIRLEQLLNDLFERLGLAKSLTSECYT